MLTKKQVMCDQVTTSKTDKTSTTQKAGAAGGLRTIMRAKRQVGNSSSMMSLLKTRENQGQGAAAKAKHPVIFGAIGGKK